MSTRERAQIIFDRLTDEQIDMVMEFFEENFLPGTYDDSPTNEEILALLEEAEDDVRNGRVYPWEEVKAELREKYGI